MGRREHEFEPSGPPRTFGAAKKVAAATAQWAAATAHPPATQDRRSATPTGWERPNCMALSARVSQSQGWVYARREAKARTFTS